MSLAKSAKKILTIGFSYLPSALKIFLYRRAGASIGNNVEIGLGSIIIPSDFDFKKIHIEDGVVINDGVHILSKHLFLGRKAQIRPYTRIWGQSDFTMGNGAYIDTECHFDLRRDIILGNEVIISGGSWFYTHMVSHSVLEGAPAKFGPITILDRSYLGANVFVLPDITIGHDATIGARTVVTKNVNPDSIMVGNPAKEIGKTSQRTKKLTIDEKIIILKDIFYDFMHVFCEKIIILKEWDKSELNFLFGNQVILFLSKVDSFSIINEKMNEFKKPITLISLNIPEEIIEDCNKNEISWFDLDHSTKSFHTNKNDQTIQDFLESYGIKLDEPSLKK